MRGRLAFGPADLVEAVDRPQLGEDPREAVGRHRKGGGAIDVGQVPGCAEEDLAAVLDLGGDDLAGNLRGAVPVGEGQVLGPTQEHVAPSGALDTSLEAAVAAEPDEAAPVLSAALYEERRQRHLPEHDDAAQAQERGAKLRLALHGDADGVVLQVEDGPLGLHVEDVQKLMHRPPPCHEGRRARRAAREAERVRRRRTASRR